MNTKKFKKLLKQYQQGKLNENDAGKVDAWYDAFGYDEHIPPLEDAGRAERIRRNLQENLQRYIRKPVRRISTGTILRYAALYLLLPGAALLCYLYFLRADRQSTQQTALRMDTVRTTTGSLKKITLPDSSVIWLNAGSTMRYHAADFIRQREIYLDKGEAYFTVSQHSGYPFTVHTPYLSTTVLGTKFNISAYDELDYSTVNVNEGRVSVHAANTSEKQLVAAGQGVIYRKGSGKLERSTDASKDATGWMTGNIQLQDATFPELASIFYHQFGLNIRSSNVTVLQAHYTINISRNQQPEALIKLICSIHNNKYRRENNDIVIY